MKNLNDARLIDGRTEVGRHYTATMEKYGQPVATMDGLMYVTPDVYAAFLQGEYGVTPRGDLVTPGVPATWEQE